MAQDSGEAVRDRLRLRPIRPVNVPTTTGTFPVTSKASLLVGWSFRETTGAAVAGVELFNGQDTKGGAAGESEVASAGTDTQTLSDEGVLCEGGIFLNVTAGSVRGVVYARV